MADDKMEGPGSSTRPVTAFVWARMTPRRALPSQILSIQTCNFAEKTIYSRKWTRDRPWRTTRKFALKKKSTSKGENCCYNAIAVAWEFQQNPMDNLMNLHFFCINKMGFECSLLRPKHTNIPTKRFGLFNPPSLLPEHLLTRQLWVATFSLSLHFPNLPSFARCRQ